MLPDVIKRVEQISQVNTSSLTWCKLIFFFLHLFKLILEEQVYKLFFTSHRMNIT